MSLYEINKVCKNCNLHKRLVDKQFARVVLFANNNFLSMLLIPMKSFNNFIEIKHPVY